VYLNREDFLENAVNPSGKSDQVLINFIKALAREASA